MIPETVGDLLGRVLSGAADAVRKDLGDGDVGDEDDFSSQLCGRLKERFNSDLTRTQLNDVWSAHSGHAPITGRGSVKLSELVLENRTGC